MLLVLDEFPYLVESAPNLPSVPQAMVDVPDARRLPLVICGLNLGTATARAHAGEALRDTTATVHNPFAHNALRIKTGRFWPLDAFFWARKRRVSGRRLADRPCRAITARNG